MKGKFIRARNMGILRDSPMGNIQFRCVCHMNPRVSVEFPKEQTLALLDFKVIRFFKTCCMCINILIN